MNQFAASVPSSPSPVFGIASLALGIIGLCMMVPTLLIWLCGIFPFILGVAAVIVGVLGITRVSRQPDKYSGKVLAYIGTLLGVLAIIAPILWALFAIVLYAYLGMAQPRRYY